MRLTFEKIADGGDMEGKTIESGQTLDLRTALNGEEAERKVRDKVLADVGKSAIAQSGNLFSSSA